LREGVDSLGYANERKEGDGLFEGRTREHCVEPDVRAEKVLERGEARHPQKEEQD